MNCRRAQTLIHSFVDGMIGDEDRSRLERHLGECQDCETMARQLAKSLDLIHRIEPIQVSDNFNWKVKLAIARERNEMVSRGLSDRNWWRRWNQRFAWSAAATFAVVVFAGYAVVQSPLLNNDSPAAQERVAAADEKQEASPARQPQAQSPTRDIALQQPGFVGPTVVSNGRSLPRENPSPPPGTIEEADTPLLIQSLAEDFRKRQAREVRVEALEEQIKALNQRLMECGAPGAKTDEP